VRHDPVSHDSSPLLSLRAPWFLGSLRWLEDLLRQSPASAMVGGRYRRAESPQRPVQGQRISVHRTTLSSDLLGDLCVGSDKG
jgi:hypothetical protein